MFTTLNMEENTVVAPELRPICECPCHGSCGLKSSILTFLPWYLDPRRYLVHDEPLHSSPQ